MYLTYEKHHTDLRGKYIEEDYSNMDSDTNIASINSHPQYITLQIIDNELIYSISDGTLQIIDNEFI